MSKLFDWFKEDFEPRARYFAGHAALLASDPEHRRRIAEERAPLVFLDYDWSLNDANAAASQPDLSSLSARATLRGEPPTIATKPLAAGTRAASRP